VGQATGPLTKTFALRAIAKLRPGTFWDYPRARVVAEMTGSTVAEVKRALWPASSAAAATRAFARLRSRVAAASKASGWPLEIAVSGREPDATVEFRGRLVPFTPSEMGL
jgi:hypothetical protein